MIPFHVTGNLLRLVIFADLVIYCCHTFEVFYHIIYTRYHSKFCLFFKCAMLFLFCCCYFFLNSFFMVLELHSDITFILRAAFVRIQQNTWKPESHIFCVGLVAFVSEINGNTTPTKKPHTQSCYYICQDCLVHLGDIGNECFRYCNTLATQVIKGTTCMIFWSLILCI